MSRKKQDLNVHKFWENHKNLTKSANWFEFCSVIGKSTWTFRHIFVTFSEYMNITWNHKCEGSLWNVKSHDAILHGIFCSLLSFISIGGHRFLFWLQFPVVNYERKMIRMLLSYLWFCWIRFPQAVTCLGLLYFIENYVSLTLYLCKTIFH